MKDKNILEETEDEIESVTQELLNEGKDPNDTTERWRVIARRYLARVDGEK